MGPNSANKGPHLFFPSQNRRNRVSGTKGNNGRGENERSKGRMHWRSEESRVVKGWGCGWMMEHFLTGTRPCASPQHCPSYQKQSGGGGMKWQFDPKREKDRMSTETNTLEGSAVSTQAFHFSVTHYTTRRHEIVECLLKVFQKYHCVSILICETQIAFWE